MIFHYHYQWSNRDERDRKVGAIREHLSGVEALRSRDAAAVTASCKTHMATARLTLLAAIPRSAAVTAADRAAVAAKARAPRARGRK